MTVADFPTFLERLAEAFDPDELVDMLNLSSTDIVEAFADQVEAARKKGMFPELEDTE